MSAGLQEKTLPTEPLPTMPPPTLLLTVDDLPAVLRGSEYVARLQTEIGRLTGVIMVQRRQLAALHYRVRTAELGRLR
jgi:hypothetical protein